MAKVALSSPVDPGEEFDALFRDSRDISAPAPLFARDGKWINDRFREHGADILPTIAAFTLLSIQQPFFSVPMQLADVKRNGSQSRYLFGSKRDGLEYVRAHKHTLAIYLKACDAGELSHVNMIWRLCAIPGLGMVKASFLSLLAIGQGICMDGHNAKRFNMPARFTRYTKRNHGQPEARGDVKIATYRQNCQQIIPDDWMWDDWCHHVAGTTHNAAGAAYAYLWKSADEVSAHHHHAVTMGEI